MIVGIKIIIVPSKMDAKEGEKKEEGKKVDANELDSQAGKSKENIEEDSERQLKAQSIQTKKKKRKN